jgi:hypothetical protein
MRSGLQFHTGKTGPKARNQQARNSSRQDLRSGLCKTQRILGPFDADSMVRRPDMESSFPKKKEGFFFNFCHRNFSTFEDCHSNSPY